MPFPIAAAIGLGSSLLGGLFAGKTSKEEKALADMETQRIKYLMDKGQRLDAIGIPGIQESLRFYRGLASGDRDILSRYYGPALNQLAESNRRNADFIYQNYSRGGAQELALAEQRFRHGADVGRILAGAPEEGFRNIANISSTLLGGGQAASQAASAIDFLDYQRRREQQQQLNLQQILTGAASAGGQLFDFFNQKKGQTKVQSTGSSLAGTMPKRTGGY